MGGPTLGVHHPCGDICPALSEKSSSERAVGVGKACWSWTREEEVGVVGAGERGGEHSREQGAFHCRAWYLRGPSRWPRPEPGLRGRSGQEPRGTWVTSGLADEGSSSALSWRDGRVSVRESVLPAPDGRPWAEIQPRESQPDARLVRENHGHSHGRGFLGTS